MSAISDKIIKARKPQPLFPVIEEIAGRFSPRYFSADPIPASDINSILEAARLTPSARNNQPWYFHWTRNNTKSFNKLYKALSPINKWAATAPVLIVCSYINQNEHGINEFALYDLGAAVLSIVLQATNLGYNARQMGIFDKTEVAKIIQAREEEIPFIIIALGEIGDYSQASAELINKDLSPSLRQKIIAEEI